MCADPDHSSKGLHGSVSLEKCRRLGHFSRQGCRASATLACHQHILAPYQVTRVHSEIVRNLWWTG